MFNNNVNLIDLTYEFFKENVKKEHSFNEIINNLFSIKGIDKKDLEDNLGNFYVELLRDTRFLISSNNKWILSESLSLNEYKAKKNDLYDFTSNEVNEDYDENILLPKINDDLEDDEILTNDFDYDIELSDNSLDDISNEDKDLDDEE